MRLHVLINGAAGSVVDADQTVADIEAAFASVGGESDVDSVEVTVDVVHPADLADLVTRVWERDRPDAVVIAGGDGTVNAAVAAAVDSEAVLSVLPLGTFNHFAGDLGIPNELTAAAQAIATGSVRTIDVGEVNGRVFVNNSVLGAYPMMVDARERIQDGRGWSKFRALPVAVLHVARNLPVHRFDLTGSGGYTRMKVRTPFIFVGNGLFDNEPGTAMARTSMDDGVLGVSVARVVSRWGMVRAAVGTLVKGAAQARDLDHVQVAELTVRSSRKSGRVAFDGEVEKMAFPLHYRCRPGALKVLAPAVEGETVDGESLDG
ncbi:MAG: diacylglycerol kinase family protein [Aquihabitans sp.]